MSGLLSGEQKLTGKLSGTGSLNGGKMIERGLDGFSPIIRTFQDEKGCDVEITDIRGTRIVRIKNGEKGESGVASPVGGFFTMSVDEDGNLWVHGEADNMLEFEYDNETGALYVVQEREE